MTDTSIKYLIDLCKLKARFWENAAKTLELAQKNEETFWEVLDKQRLTAEDKPVLTK